jgi:hypothetical protein
VQPPTDFGTDSPGSKGERDLAARAADDLEIARRFTADPFVVLQAPCTATRRELEHAACALLDALSRGDGGRYPTALGERVRDADAVEQARVELRDAEVRILHEVWARLPVRRQPLLRGDGPAPWRGGLRALGWRSR